MTEVLLAIYFRDGVSPTETSSFPGRSALERARSLTPRPGLQSKAVEDHGRTLLILSFWDHSDAPLSHSYAVR
jgi:hypothetical protein